MSNISFAEFMKLSQEKKMERYKDLSSHDKFLARLADGSDPAVDIKTKKK